MNLYGGGGWLLDLVVFVFLLREFVRRGRLALGFGSFLVVILLFEGRDF